ncbi:hypothetical protein V8G54_009105 [Vigna mungo]|uniref:Uncharacterized protein n=1 Tax=Vigna mungo TaxID=3915 RepID=A0AAQ3NV57_VIGMU
MWKVGPLSTLHLLRALRNHLIQHPKCFGIQLQSRDILFAKLVEGPTFWPIKILERRQIQQGEEEVQQILVEWQERGRDGATWEDVLTIKDQYLDFNLEDKVDDQATGNFREVNLLTVLAVRSGKKLGIGLLDVSCIDRNFVLWRGIRLPYILSGLGFISRNRTTPLLVFVFQVSSFYHRMGDVCKKFSDAQPAFGDVHWWYPVSHLMVLEVCEDRRVSRRLFNTSYPVTDTMHI